MKTLRLAFTVKIAVTTLIFVVIGSLLFSVGSAYAVFIDTLGTNITQYDGVASGGVVGSIGSEDNETEPGTVKSQSWDLEGFFLKGKSLSIVGGYNFYTGNAGMMSGDIFIDTNGDAVYSPSFILPSSGFGGYTRYKELDNSYFKYDYVLDIDWVSGSFNIVELTSNTKLKNTAYDNFNTPSNPWIYVSGGNVEYSGNFNTYGKNSFSDADTGFSGWSGTNGAGKHYVATFDISSINLDKGAVFHNTMECGNDNLIGKSEAAPVPEPGTMALLGFGMLGLAIYGKRRMNKEAR